MISSNYKKGDMSHGIGKSGERGHGEPAAAEQVSRLDDGDLFPGAVIKEIPDGKHPDVGRIVPLKWQCRGFGGPARQEQAPT